MVRLTDRPDMTLDVYRGRKTTTQQQPLALSLVCLFQNIYIVKTTTQQQPLALSLICLFQNIYIVSGCFH